MRKARVSVCVVVSSVAAWALVTAYHIDPKTAAMSGWTSQQAPNNRVSEIITVAFDLPITASLFCGSPGAGGTYSVGIFSYPDGVVELAYNHGAESPKDHDWLTCSLTVVYPDSFIKGRKVEVRWTRGGSDSIQYYYDERNPYPEFGWLKVGGELDEYQLDLCMRLEGQMKVCPPEYFGYNLGGQELVGSHRDTVKARAQTAEVRMDRLGLNWRSVETESAGAWTFGPYDDIIHWRHKTVGLELVGLLVTCPKWASTRIDSVWFVDTILDTAYMRLDTSIYCPPCSLFLPVSSQHNYWARFVDTMVRRYGDSIHVWECWNETNLRKFWQVPNSGEYIIGPDTARGLCSLYIRLCCVADSVIHAASPGDTVLIGSMSEVENATGGRVAGKDWLRMCNGIADTVFWEGVSVHPYSPSWDPVFRPARFEAEAETLRRVMRANGDYGPLWITELGWNTEAPPSDHLCSPTTQAAYMCETFTSAKATEAQPAGGYDRMCWYTFLDDYDHFGVVNDSSQCFAPKQSFWASGQTAELLAGARFSGRTITGDPWKDENTRIFEFDAPATLGGHSRFWVAWRNGDASFGNNEPPPVDVSIPTRTNTVEWEFCAYSGGNERQIDTAATDGWFDVSLGTRPQFIFEPETCEVCRPDMMVDSIWMVPSEPLLGQQVSLFAKVKNHGNDSTASGDPVAGRRGTVVTFYRDDEVVGEVEYSPGIDTGKTVQFEMYWLPQYVGLFLLKAVVNDGQRYVELGMDDNPGYLRFRIRQGASVTASVPPGGSNVPVVLTGLVTAGPADSCRFFQEYLGLGDTVLAVDSTPWLLLSEAEHWEPGDTAPTIVGTGDTVWRFTCGEGRYKLLAEFCDSAGPRESCYYWQFEGYPPALESVVVFDSTPPVADSVLKGGIVLNAGARFTREAWCTVRSGMTDSVSGMGEIHLANRSTTGLLSDPGFDPTGTGWTLSGPAAYDSAGMVEMTLSATQPARVRQFLTAAQLTPYIGQETRMRLSLNAVYKTADPTGNVRWYWRFGYVLTHEGTQGTDTAWQWLREESFGPGAMAWVGTQELATDLTLYEPEPDSGWTWCGGVVEAYLPEDADASGRVYLDNARLEPWEPHELYGWWQPYDTLSWCSLEPGTGYRTVWARFRDRAGAQCLSEPCDSVILDMGLPQVYNDLANATWTSGWVAFCGWAYDSVAVEGDTWFEWRRLSYRHPDSSAWLPCAPDSVSYQPAWGDTYTRAYLGCWSTVDVPDGPYYIRLSAADSAGNTSEHIGWFVVNNSGDGDASCSLDDATVLGAGSVWCGTGRGMLYHFDEELDSLASFQVDTAAVTAFLKLADDSLLVGTGNRVTKTSQQGAGKRLIAGGLGRVSDITQDPSGSYWLADRQRGLVAKFRPNGTLAFTRGGPGADSVQRLDHPEAIVAKNDQVYVADAGNNRIAVWDTAGNYRHSITGDFSGPTALAVTDAGLIYAVDTAGTVLGLNRLGKRFRTIRDDDGRAYTKLCLSRDEHHLYTYRAASRELLRYRIMSDESIPGGGGQQGGGRMPIQAMLHACRPNPFSQRTLISYQFPQAGRVVLRVYDASGRVVKTLQNGMQERGSHTVSWDGRDDKGRSVANGVYFYRVDAPGLKDTKKAVVTK